MGIVERFQSAFSLQDPTGQWQRTPLLALEVDLQRPSVNGVEMRGRLEELSFLGPAEVRDGGEYGYPSLGLAIESIDAETLTGWRMIQSDPDDQAGYAPFLGGCRLGEVRLPLAEMTEARWRENLGEPYWRDEDELEVILFYEFQYHELQIELTRAGQLKCITVTSFPLMANADQREAYGVTRPWPPERRP